MIKINLAAKKKAAFVADHTSAKGDPLRSFKVDIDGLKEFPILPITLLVLSYIGGKFALGAFEKIKIEEVESELQVVMAEQRTLQAEQEKFKGLDKIKSQLDADELKITTKLDTIRKLVAGRKEATRTLFQLSEALPGEVWLSKFEIAQDRVTFNGKAANYNLVSDFMKKLGESSLFTDLKLENTEQVVDPSGIELAQFQLLAKKVQGSE